MLSSFIALGNDLRSGKLSDPEALSRAFIENGWFTNENTERALKALGSMLEEESLKRWLSSYKVPVGTAKTVALIMAGNIPLVGFQDLLCVLMSGHKALVKMASDDRVLLPHILRSYPEVLEKIEWTDGRLRGFDAMIATGSNNSSRYFEHYFSRYPHIFRKSRTSVAVLNGKESGEQLNALGADIFNYFGLGCRSVSKLYVPTGYDFNSFFQAIYPFREVLLNKKYGNNYDYYRAIYLMNGAKLLDNNFVLLKEDTHLHSPPAVIFYEFYEHREDLAKRLQKVHEQLQCVVSGETWPGAVPFGRSQFPGPGDYPDGIDLMKFLSSL